MGQLSFFFDVKVPHTNFNKSRSMFQGVPGNTGLPLVKNNGRNQRKYINFHIGERHIRFYPAAIYRRSASDQNVLDANLPMLGFGSERVN